MVPLDRGHCRLLAVCLLATLSNLSDLCRWQRSYRVISLGRRSINSQSIRPSGKLRNSSSVSISVLGCGLHHYLGRLWTDLKARSMLETKKFALISRVFGHDFVVTASNRGNLRGWDRSRRLERAEHVQFIRECLCIPGGIGSHVAVIRPFGYRSNSCRGLKRGGGLDNMSRQAVNTVFGTGPRGSSLPYTPQGLNKQPGNVVIQ